MRCAAALLVLLLLCPGRAGAQVASLGDYDVSLTETFYADWHRNFIYGSGKSSTTYDYFDVKNRLNVHARSRALQAGMRMDMAGFIGPSSGPSGENFQGQFDNDIGVEKFYARYRHKAMGVEVGDVYGCLGKGIALCVKKMDELATDTTVRGLKVYYNGRTFGAMAMGGLTNLVNVGDLIEQKLPDPNDLVSGAELRFSPVYWARATVHGGLLVDRNELPDEAKNALGFVELWDDNSGAAARREMLLTVGPTLSFPDLFDVGSLMLEYDAMVQTWTGGDEADHPDPLAAHALYTLRPSMWVWHTSWLRASGTRVFSRDRRATTISWEPGSKESPALKILPTTRSCPLSMMRRFSPVTTGPTTLWAAAFAPMSKCRRCPGWCSLHIRILGTRTWGRPGPMTTICTMSWEVGSSGWILSPSWPTRRGAGEKNIIRSPTSRCTTSRETSIFPYSDHTAWR